MITKRTIVDQREVTASGAIQVRLRKEIVEDGKVISFGYHRLVVQPGDEVSDVLDPVHKDLADNHGYPALAADEVHKIVRLVEMEHTDAVVLIFEAQVEAALRAVQNKKAGA